MYLKQETKTGTRKFGSVKQNSPKSSYTEQKHKSEMTKQKNRKRRKKR